MMTESHPFRDVAIVGVYNTQQTLGLGADVDLDALDVEVALGAAADAGIPVESIDGLISNVDTDLAYQLRLAPVWRAKMEDGIAALIAAAGAIAAGYASCILVTSSPAS